jgi:basic membrane lipoprotein Med (substrate-binding protein (PBP1-ABC) superfamily)
VQKAAEATKGLITQGAELVWTSGDGIGNGVAAAAEQAGIHTLGVTGSAGGLAQKATSSASNSTCIRPSWLTLTP